MAIARVRRSRAKSAPPTRLEVLIAFYLVLDAMHLQRRQPTYAEHECLAAAVGCLRAGRSAAAMTALIELAQAPRVHFLPSAPPKSIEDWRREVDALPR